MGDGRVSDVATVLRCGCGAEVPISAYQLGLIERFGELLDSRGEPRLSLREAGQCASCRLGAARAEQEAMARRVREDARRWTEFCDQFMRTDNLEIQRAIARDFMRGCHDRRRYRPLMKAFADKARRPRRSAAARAKVGL